MRFRFLALLFITANLLGGPQVAENQNPTGNNKTRETQKGQRIVPPTHVVIDPPLPSTNTTQPPPEPSQGQSTEKPLPRFFRPEWVIVYITAFYVAVAWFTLIAIKRQANTMDRQVYLIQKEMIEAAESNKTTTALAHGTLAAMTAQALAMGRQIDVAEQQARDTKQANADTLAAISRQSDLMEGQLKEMQDAGKQTARQLGLTERPWISFSVKLIGPVTFDNENGMRVSISIELTNFGKSPAIGIWIYPHFFLPYQAARNVIDERKRIYRESIYPPTDGWGKILFPGTNPPLIEEINIGTSAAEVERGMFGNAVESAVAVQIIVCVGYRSTLDEAARHYTAVIYELETFDPNIPHMSISLPAKRNIPLNRLRLRISGLFGPLAT